MGPLERILEAFGPAAKRGDRWWARCPVHEDKHPSLRIRQGELGVLVKCSAGCRTEDVLAARGLSWGDLFADSGSPSRPIFGPKWGYRNSESSSRQLAGIVIGKAGYLDPSARVHEAFSHTWVDFDDFGEITYYSRGEW